MWKNLFLALSLVIFFNYSYSEQSTEHNVPNVSNTFTQDDDSFFIEWPAFSQEDINSDDENDALDNLINSMAVEKKEEVSKSFLHTIILSYCLKVFLLYGKVKESIQSYLKKLLNVAKEL